MTDRQTLQLREKVLGNDHLGTPKMNTLADSLRQRSKYIEAGATQRHTLQLRETMLGKDHPITLGSMNNLAESLRQQGKYAEAEAMHRQTLQLRETVLGKDHLDTLKSMNNLAESLRQQGKYAEAEAIHQQTLQLLKIVLGKDHPITLGSMNNLAISLYQQGKYAKAEAIYRQTLQLRESVLGKDHLDTLGSMNNLAELLRQQGKYPEAEAMHRQTLQLREIVLGKDHPITLGSMNNLAESLRQQGKYTEAKAIHQQTLQLRESVLGKDHPDTLGSMNNLALLLQQQGKYIEAEAIHRQTLQLREIVLRKDHPDTLVSMNNLALSLRQQGKYVDAEAIHRHTLQLRESVLGKDHPDTHRSIKNLAESLRQQGKYPEADRGVRAQSKISSAQQVTNGDQISTRASALIKATADIQTDGEEEYVMLSATDLFVQNPQSYFDSINHLQSHIFDLGRQLLGEIKQDSSTHILCLPTIIYTVVPSSNNEAVEQLRSLLERNIAMACVIMKGLQILTEIHFCNSTYNIIVADIQSDDILRVIPIAISNLQLLKDLSEEALAYCSTPTEWTLIEQTIGDLGEATLLVLRHLGLINSISGSPGDSQYRRCIYMCILLHSTCSVLFIGLISFIKSHIAAADTSFFQGGLDELEIEFVDGPISLRPRRLACLDSFIKYPIWTFSHSSKILPPSDAPPRRYYLSTLLADFADLWGPLSLVYLDEDQDLVSEIRVRGGVIRRNRSVIPNDLLRDETWCHWYSWMGPNFHLDDEHPPLPISTTKPLLIGADDKTTASAKRNERNLFHVYHTCHCKSSAPYATKYRPFELKTKIPSWKVDSRMTQMSAGQYVTLSCGQTWKFSSGWTLKDVIVEDWLERVQNDPNHHPKPYYLDYLVVLEISRCTGHTRRISLWTLFKNQVLKDYLQDVLDPGACKDFDLLTGEILRQEFPSGALFSDVWRRLQDQAREIFKLVVKSVLDNLRSTGIGEDGHLQSWDITSRGRIDGRRTDPSWRSMVKDDVETATFAIITDSCMEYTTWPHLGSRSFSQNSKSQSSTILYTKVRITMANPLELNDVGPSNSKTHTPPAQQESSEVLRKEEFIQWRVANSRSLNTTTNANRLKTVSTAREHYGLDQDAVSSIYGRQAIRKQAVNEESPLSTPSTAIVGDSMASHNRQSILNSAANPPGNQAPYRNGKFGIVNTFGQPLPNIHSNIMCDASLCFKNGQGQIIGTLILEPQEQTTQVDLSTASDGKTLRATWAAHRPSRIAFLREHGDSIDKRIADWAKKSKGTLPWIVDHFSESKRSQTSAVEHIRGGDLTAYQKVLCTCIG